MAEERERKEEGTEKEETSKKGFPVKIVVLALIILFLMGGGFLVWRNGTLNAFLGGQQKEAVASKPQEKNALQSMGPVYSLDSFIVNLNEPMGKRYLKIKIELEMDHESLKEEIDKRLPQFRDGILTMLSSKSYSDISDLSGKFQLRAEILSMLNSYLTTGKIANVYFTEFIVQ